MNMYGWCEGCRSIALEGYCSVHGETRPILEINKIDACPLPEFEKEFLNARMDRLKLGEGIFLIYGDRMLHSTVVALDKPLVEIKVTKDGVRITPLTKGEVKGMSPDSLWNANSHRLNRLVKVTKSFARQELEQNKNAIISFSGGKDSIVLAHLLEEYGLKKVFIDTTIEFPETYRFIEALKKKSWNIDVARAEKSFFKLLPEKGYPARKNRWCCKTQKFNPFERYIKEHFGEETISVFGAERRWESLYRIDQPFKKQHKYISNQYSIHIMLDWTAMDVWIYTWKHSLPVNEIYHYYDRGGCWPCPFGLTYRSFLMEHAHPKLYSFLDKVGAISKSYGVSIRPCMEGKPMKHLVFSNEHLMNIVAKLIPSVCDTFEIHNTNRVICVPANLSNVKLKALVKEARTGLIGAH
ncbi:MAG: phosphoadenosine phosphosulfate reductase family protein [Candidatus Bathyarchaeia archaeon]|jgi:3'-phosphoadenosine 5'-phosphosulfate sulfotransferase (PAPS reductase)/FAD synthetase|nr:phosphoadenosine phosphosulfate reductase family protein [Candidatus Bathyarchaeota archaeon A05DMB-3]